MAEFAKRANTKPMIPVKIISDKCFAFVMAHDRSIPLLLEIIVTLTFT